MVIFMWMLLPGRKSNFFCGTLILIQFSAFAFILHLFSTFSTMHYMTSGNIVHNIIRSFQMLFYYNVQAADSAVFVPFDF